MFVNVNVFIIYATKAIRSKKPWFTGNLRSVVLVENPRSCYKFNVNHGFTGIAAFIKRLFVARFHKIKQSK